MWNELGISGGTAIVILIALYFVIKWAVKNGVKEAYKDITGKKPVEDEKNEKELEGLVKLHDKEYQDKLQVQSDYWEKLKTEIEAAF